MSDDRIIKVPEPRREWLLHCEGDQEDVFVLTVSGGAVEIIAPEYADLLRLERAQIAEFRQALDAAIEVAEADLCAQRAERQAVAHA